MSGRMYDAYVMVDWSAASKPTTGKDSIWIGVHHAGVTTVENIPTRHAAMARLGQIARRAVADGTRVLMGFDFPFGYPRGVAQTLTGEPQALALWAWLAKKIEDAPDNANNRYTVADAINRIHFDGIGPFWGRPATWPYLDIPTRATSRTVRGHPAERRLADQAAKGAKTVWQLAYAGSVGSQVLLGLPAIWRLRHEPDLADHIRIWPFETGLTAPTAPIVLAEIYPSLIPPDTSEAINDAGQIRAVADWLAGLDRDGALAPLFAGPPEASAAQRRAIATEEAWILGLDAPAVRVVSPAAPLSGPPAAPPADGEVHRGAAGTRPPPLRDPGDPDEIDRQSIALIRAEARLDHLPQDLQPVAIRLVQVSGMPDIPNRLAWSADLARTARAALEAGAPVLCDTEAVAAMILGADLPAGNAVLCPQNAPWSIVPSTENTSDPWQDRLLDGAVIAIGTAPAALVHLLDMLDRGAARPAAILGFPVGFVGAAEAKAELATNPRGTPFLTLRGRRGGPSMAAAAVNALAAGQELPA